MTYSEFIELYEKFLRTDLSKHFIENYDNKETFDEEYIAYLYCNNSMDENSSVRKIITLHLESRTIFNNPYKVPSLLMFNWLFDMNDNIIKSNIKIPKNIDISDDTIGILREELENNGETFMVLKYGRELPTLEYILFIENSLNKIFNTKI